MYAAFTGTRAGLTEAQRATLTRILRSPRLRIVRLSHGGAVGADAEAHALALEAGIEVWVRPSDRPDQSAPCEGASRRFEPLPPLERNRHVVADGGLLVACPAGREQQGGTWWTIRHARGLGYVDVLCVWPDGSTTSWRRTGQRPVPRACGGRAYADSSAAPTGAGEPA